MRPTRERWRGPVDLDAAAAARADELNATWVASAEPSWWLKPGYHLSYMEEVPPYPYQRIKRVDGRDTGVLAIIAPFYDLDYYRAELARAFFWRLKANGHIIIVITSYQEFPGRIDNPYDDRHTTPQDRVIHEAVDGYLHCFREPDKFIPQGVPRILLSESDFHDPDREDGGGSLKPNGVPKQWDIFYSNQGGDWNDYARNWTLAKACFKRLIVELNLKVLIMGRDLSGEADHDLSPLISSGHITTQPPSTPWRDFLHYIEASRVLFAPNLHDASPRVLAEALCLDVPVLVNRRILGGWKYVTGATGAFFDGEHDVVGAASALLSERRAAELQPRRWFKANWGKERATLRLQAFLELAVGRERLKAAQDLATARITYKT